MSAGFGRATLPRRLNTTGIAWFPPANDSPFVCRVCGEMRLGRPNQVVCSPEQSPACRREWRRRLVYRSAARREKLRQR